MKHIQLHGRHGEGKVSIVDDEDFLYLNQWKWFANHLGYVYRVQRLPEDRSLERVGQKVILIHRVIMNTPEGMVTDHANRNVQDNQKINLRVCLQRQNSYNRDVSKYSSSGYVGVNWEKESSKWVAKIRFDGVEQKLGRFFTKEQAAIVYNHFVKEYRGEFAYYNEVSESIMSLSDQQAFFEEWLATRGYRPNKSGLRGVRKVPSGRWQVRIGHPAKVIGIFNNREEAAETYDRAAIQMYGDKARLNKIDYAN